MKKPKDMTPAERQSLYRDRIQGLLPPRSPVQEVLLRIYQGLLRSSVELEKIDSQ